MVNKNNTKSTYEARFSHVLSLIMSHSAYMNPTQFQLHCAMGPRHNANSMQCIRVTARG